MVVGVGKCKGKDEKKGGKAGKGLLKRDFLTEEHGANDVNHMVQRVNLCKRLHGGWGLGDIEKDAAEEIHGRHPESVNIRKVKGAFNMGGKAQRYCAIGKISEKENKNNERDGCGVGQGAQSPRKAKQNKDGGHGA